MGGKMGPHTETCSNCGRAIGPLEQANLWRGHVVCNECYARLGAGAPASVPSAKAAPRVSPFALASLVCGLAGLPPNVYGCLFLSWIPGLGLVAIIGMLIFVVPGVLGVVFGHMAMRRIRLSRGSLTGRGLALGGQVCGYVTIFLWIISALLGLYIVGRLMVKP